MIGHLVLFRPREALPTGIRTELVEALRVALDEIPSIRRVRIGRRRSHGGQYEPLMKIDYQYAAVFDFDDLAGLQAYLEHPAHARLAVAFFSAFEEALMYDFEFEAGAPALDDLLRESPSS